MNATDYIEQGIKPKVGDVISSPHRFISKRGHPLYHKVLEVKRKRRSGKLEYFLKVETRSILKKLWYDEPRELWLDELD